MSDDVVEPGEDAPSSDDDAEPSQEEAGRLLVNYCLDLHYAGLMNARQLCTICHWAEKGGCKGSVRDFALRPDSPTGHFQRKVDRATGVTLSEVKKSLYRVQVPQHSKHDSSRSTHNMPVKLPHEEMAKEIQENPAAAVGKPEPEWTEAFRSHPVVARNPGVTVIPYALYLDVIIYVKNDSLLGVFVYNLYTNKRHLCVILRRSDFCRCGCRGWCTLFPIFTTLKWSFRALASGVYPSERHDGPWGEADRDRADKGGTRLGLIGALLFLKGDWSEYAHTFGLADWSSVLYPCFFCKATRETRFNVTGFSPHSSPWPDLTHMDYDEACAQCEIWVRLSLLDYGEVKGALGFDRKKGRGAGGAFLSRI